MLIVGKYLMLTDMYAVVAYVVMLLTVLCFCYQKNRQRLPIKPNFALLAMIVVSVAVVLGYLPIWQGVFALPSALTVALCIYFLVVSLSCGRYTPISRRALVWYSMVAWGIVWSALGALPIFGVDIYHQYLLDWHIIVHYVIFLLVFLVGYLLDKKTVVLAWFCLLALMLSLQNSQFVLDYVADVWLFMLGLWLFIRWLGRVLKRLGGICFVALGINKK